MAYSIKIKSSSKAFDMEGKPYGYLQEPMAPVIGPKSLPERWKGKQLLGSLHAKLQDCEVGHFGKITYAPLPFESGNTRYRESEPLDKRKLGFLSHDATRRDEFTSSLRSRQYREQLHSEHLVSSAALASSLRAAGASTLLGSPSAAAAAAGGQGTPSREFGSTASPSALQLDLSLTRGEPRDGGMAMPSYSPIKTSTAALSASGSLGAGATASPGGAAGFTVLPDGSRNFTKRTQYERLYDPKPNKEIYGTQRLHHSDAPTMSYGPLSTTAAVYGEDIERTEHSPPRHKRVAVLSKDIYRPNGVPIASSRML